MGPWGGFVTGLAETIEYVFTTAVIVYFSASYANAATDELFGLDLADACGCGGSSSTSRSSRSTPPARRSPSGSPIVVAVLSIGVLVLFAVLALVNGAVDFGLLTTSSPRAATARFLPFGWEGPLRAAVRDVVLPRHRGAAPRGRGGARPGQATSREPASSGWSRCVGRLRWCSFLNPAVTGSAAIGRIGRAAARRLPGLPPRRLGRDAVAVRADRPARQAAGDHVRLRPQHVLAVAGRLLPEGALAHRLAEDAVDRAGASARVDRPRGAGRRRPRIGGTAGDIVLNIAVWGAVHRLRAADGLVRPAAPEVPERRPALPQPARRSRRRGGRRDRGADLRRRPAQRATTGRRSSRSPSSTPSAWSLFASSAATG